MNNSVRWDSGGGGQLEFLDGNGGRQRWWTAAVEDSATTEDDGCGRRLDFSSMATAAGATVAVTRDDNILYI
jgi:hypothetical protein